MGLTSKSPKPITSPPGQTQGTCHQPYDIYYTSSPRSFDPPVIYERFIPSRMKAELESPPLEGSIALRFAHSRSRFPPYLAAPGLSLSHPHCQFPTFNPARITDCPASSPSTCGSEKGGRGGGSCVHVTILSSVVVTCVAEAQGKDICNDPPPFLFLLCPLTNAEPAANGGTVNARRRPLPQKR